MPTGRSQLDQRAAWSEVPVRRGNVSADGDAVIGPCRNPWNIGQDVNPATVVAHIRMPMDRRKGNQYYRDQRERKVATVCGAPVTEYDTDHRCSPWGVERLAAFADANPGRICAACLEKRKAMK